MKLLKSVQFKRKVTYVTIAGAVIGGLYLMYYKGRADEIKELYEIAYEYGETVIHIKNGIKTLIISTNDYND